MVFFCLVDEIVLILALSSTNDGCIRLGVSNMFGEKEEWGLHLLHTTIELFLNYVNVHEFWELFGVTECRNFRFLKL